MPKLSRPEGHHSITPSFIVPQAAKVIAFLEKAFGGKVVDRYDGPGGSVAHAEVMIDGSVVMCGEPMPGWDAMPARSRIRDDGARRRGVQSRARRGRESVAEPKKSFGYRSATVSTPGNKLTSAPSGAGPRGGVVRRRRR